MRSSSSPSEAMRKIAATAASRTFGVAATGTAPTGTSARSRRARTSSARTPCVPLLLDLAAGIDPGGDAARERHCLVALRAQHLGCLCRARAASAVHHDLAFGSVCEGVAGGTAHACEGHVDRARDAEEIPFVLLPHIEER